MKKRQRLLQIVVTLMTMLWTVAAVADTIYFSDGSYIRCKIHDKPIVFVQKAKDPDFVEIEIPYGVFGFYKDQRVLKIEKDDLYSPEEKSMSLVDIFSRLGAGPGELLVQQTDEQRVDGRDLRLEVLNIIGWAFDKTNPEQSLSLTNGQVVEPERILSVPPNGRMKASVLDTAKGGEPLAILGLVSSSTAQYGQMRYDQGENENVIPIGSLVGKMWVEVRDPFLEGRTSRLDIGALSIKSETSTFYLQSDGNQLKIAALAGPDLAISIEDVVEDTIVENGDFVVLQIADGSQIEKGRAADDELKEWTTWDAWEPTIVAIPLTMILPDMMSYPPKGPDFIGSGDVDVAAGSRTNQPLLTKSLGERLQDIRSALQRYSVDVGQFPSKEQGLAALFEDPGVENWKGPYLPKDSKTTDFWGNEIIYSLWTDLDGNIIADVRSAGPNQVDDLGLVDDLR